MQNKLGTYLGLGLVGLTQGCLFTAFKNVTVFSPSFHAGLLAFIVLTCLFIELAWSGRAFLRLISSSIILAGIFSLSIGWRYGQDFTLISDYIIGCSLLIYSIYIIITYHQTYQVNGNFVFPYHQLFQNSWDTLFLIFLAFLFSQLCSLLITLLNLLLIFINSEFFTAFINSNTWYHQLMKILSPVYFAVGIAIGKEYETAIYELRKIVLTIFTFLLPALSTLGLIFVVSFLAKIIFHTNYSFSPIALVTMIFVSFLTIIFINAVIQDGKNNSSYPRLIKLLVTIFIVAAPIFPIIALYFQGLEATKSGVDIHLFQELWLTIIFSVYLVCYALASFSSATGWMCYLPKINIILSLLVVVTTLLLNSPLFDVVSIIKQHKISLLKIGKSSNSLFLPHADLKGLELVGENLFNANLSYADLSYTDLSNTNLSFANLRYANLSHAKLINTNLTNAILDNATLSDADLNQAKLDNASLRNTVGLTQAQLNTVHCKSYHWSQALPVGLSIPNCKEQPSMPSRQHQLN